MVDRKLYKALCRVQEVSKARAGHRRSLTWSNVSEVLPHLHPPYKEQLSALLQTPDGPQSSAAATVVLQRAIEQQAQLNRSKRLAAGNFRCGIRSATNLSGWLNAGGDRCSLWQPMDVGPLLLYKGVPK